MILLKCKLLQWKGTNQSGSNSKTFDISGRRSVQILVRTPTMVRFTHISPGKCQIQDLNLVGDHFHIFSNSSITNQPTIQQYTVKSIT